jgi:hypothetical protein
MSTLDQAGLVQLLESLAISAANLSIAESTVLSNPLDLCRATLAGLLSGLVDCDIQAAYSSIQWPNNIFNGDLSVTVPKLCPGRKPAELSTQLVDGVCRLISKTKMVKLIPRPVSKGSRPFRSTVFGWCPFASLPEARSGSTPPFTIHLGTRVHLWVPNTCGRI